MTTMKQAASAGVGEPCSRFKRDVLAGLSLQEKSLPSHYFYDAVGSDLFEQITVLPEYYPTRTEISILQGCAGQIAADIAPGTVLVEFGSGSSVKTNILLAACPAITCYIPIDVSHASLALAQQRLAVAFPTLRVEPVLGDFTGSVVLPADVAAAPKLGFFPGSTIGNFSHEAAITLLASFRHVLGTGSRLILGADLRKSPDILIPAYNDAAGVTAAFNLNLLARINRELSGDLELKKFSHLATYDKGSGRINMYLVSLAEQTATVCGEQFGFAKGERIHTEISQKYEISEMRDLAERAGWMADTVWTDAAELFSVHELRVPLEA